MLFWGSYHLRDGMKPGVTKYWLLGIKLKLHRRTEAGSTNKTIILRGGFLLPWLILISSRSRTPEIYECVHSSSYNVYFGRNLPQFLQQTYVFSQLITRMWYIFYYCPLSSLRFCTCKPSWGTLQTFILIRKYSNRSEISSSLIKTTYFR